MGCQREDYKDGFNMRHSQRQAMGTAATIGEKASVGGFLLRNREVEVLDVYSVCFS